MYIQCRPLLSIVLVSLATIYLTARRGKGLVIVQTTFLVTPLES